jgi:MFS family permease
VTVAKHPKRAPSHHAWEIVALLWVAYFLNQGDRQIFGVTLSLIRRDFGLDDTQMGLVATTFSIVFGLLVPIAGVVGDRVRRERVVILSLIVFSAGTLLTGQAMGLISLLIFRGVATGVGEALYAPAASTLIAQLHDATRTRALALHQTANYTGVVVGSLFAGWVADHFGWRASFVTFGAAGLAWAAVIYFRARRFPAPIVAHDGPKGTGWQSAIGGLRMIAGSPALIAQAIGFSGLVFVLVGYLTWMPTILTERFGLSTAEAGFQAVFVHHLMGYAGLLAAGWASDRWLSDRPQWRLATMGAAMVLCAPSIWVSGFAASPPLVYLALGLFGLTRGVYDANLFAAIFDHVPDRLRATVTSWIVAVAYFVGAIAPAAMGALKQHYGIQAGMDMLACVAAGSGIVFLVTLLVAVRMRRSYAR